MIALSVGYTDDEARIARAQTTTLVVGLLAMVSPVTQRLYDALVVQVSKLLRKDGTFTWKGCFFSFISFIVFVPVVIMKLANCDCCGSTIAMGSCNMAGDDINKLATKMINEGLVKNIEEGVAEVASRAFWQQHVKAHFRRDKVQDPAVIDAAVRLVQARWRARKARRAEACAAEPAASKPNVSEPAFSTPTPAALPADASAADVARHWLMHEVEKDSRQLLRDGRLPAPSHRPSGAAPRYDATGKRILKAIPPGLPPSWPAAAPSAVVARKPALPVRGPSALDLLGDALHAQAILGSGEGEGGALSAEQAADMRREVKARLRAYEQEYKRAHDGRPPRQREEWGHMWPEYARYAALRKVGAPATE